MANVDLNEGLQDCNAALASHPGQAAILDSRGWMHLRMGENGKALEDFNAAITVKTDEASSIFGRGLAKLRLDQKDAGQADLVQATILAPKLPERMAKFGFAP